MKKDETPYLIFACKKCKEYSYVKTVQKIKKCLRCGRTHQVSEILKYGAIVYGITEAVNTVKKKQNKFAIPEFRSGSDFVVATNNVVRSKRKVNTLKNKDQEIIYKSKFNEMLIDLSKLYAKFPLYMIEIMAEDFGIPTLEIKILINLAKKSGILILSIIHI